MIGFWGVFISMIINMFLKSPQLDFMMSAVGVFIFTGMAAYKTQAIKNLYYMAGNNTALQDRASIYGALTLYVTFVNLFLFLLRFMGNSRR
jgi:hypothetical protein